MKANARVAVRFALSRIKAVGARLPFVTARPSRETVNLRSKLLISSLLNDAIKKRSELSVKNDISVRISHGCVA
ncbi:hypothetical protein SRHO_G00222440 [Serrasalmus rhombeus]